MTCFGRRPGCQSQSGLETKTSSSPSPETAGLLFGRAWNYLPNSPSATQLISAFHLGNLRPVPMATAGSN